ncbi:hypothetical protein D3C85_1437610 [compost metagenome]
MHDATWLPMRVEHRQGIEIGLAAKQFEHLRRGRLAVHRGLFDQQRGEVAAVFIEALQHLRRLPEHALHIPRRQLLRAAQQVALDQVDAHLGEHLELFGQFDTFGNHLGS